MTSDEFYTEYDMRKDPTYHVMCNWTKGELWCARCRGMKHFASPMMAEQFIEEVRLFINEHRKCPKTKT